VIEGVERMIVAGESSSSPPGPMPRIFESTQKVRTDGAARPRSIWLRCPTEISASLATSAPARDPWPTVVAQLLADPDLKVLEPKLEARRIGLRLLRAFAVFTHGLWPIGQSHCAVPSQPS